MNVMEEIFEIISCIEILANDVCLMHGWNYAISNGLQPQKKWSTTKFVI